MSAPVVVYLGEILIDFMGQPAAADLSQVEHFVPKPGGAPANVAVGLRRLGVSSAFIGMVGEDAFGHMLRGVLEAEQVDTRGLTSTAEQPTTLAFVAISESGVPSFAFVRHPGADLSLRRENVDTERISAAKVFHFGSLSLVSDPAYSATWFALEQARKAGCFVTYDPNYRPALWSSVRQARDRMLEPMAHVDLVKVSVEELALLTGETTQEAGAATLHALGPKLIIITLGAEGIAASNGSAWVQLPAIPVAAVDTTGCGDASMAGVIASLLRDLPDLKAGMAVPEEVLLRAIHYANRCGAKAATRMGAIPSLPYASEVPID